MILLFLSFHTASEAWFGIHIDIWLCSPVFTEGLEAGLFCLRLSEHRPSLIKDEDNNTQSHLAAGPAQTKHRDWRNTPHTPAGDSSPELLHMPVASNGTEEISVRKTLNGDAQKSNGASSVNCTRQLVFTLRGRSAPLCSRKGRDLTPFGAAFSEQEASLAAHREAVQMSL